MGQDFSGNFVTFKVIVVFEHVVEGGSGSIGEIIFVLKLLGTGPGVIMITHFYPDNRVFGYPDINIEKFDFIEFLAKNVFLVH